MKKLMMALLAMMAVLFGTTACGGSIFGQTRIKGSGNLISWRCCPSASSWLRRHRYG